MRKHKEREMNIKPTEYRPAVFVVMYRINPHTKIPDYLILRRKLHWRGWEFPKGGIEPQEHITETIKRECFEESGLRIIEIKQFRESGKYKYKSPLADRPGFIGQTYSLFAAQVNYENSDDIIVDEIEHEEFKWLKFNDALKILTWNNQKKCLSLVNKWLEKKLN
jgi:8-oxo-dGTP pyrophosphatase MutT (NUDIX family)